MPIQETGVPSLGWEDPLHKKMATYFSFIGWEMPWKEEPGRLQSVHGGHKDLDMTEGLNSNNSNNVYVQILSSIDSAHKIIN